MLTLCLPGMNIRLEIWEVVSLGLGGRSQWGLFAPLASGPLGFRQRVPLAPPRALGDSASPSLPQSARRFDAAQRVPTDFSSMFSACSRCREEYLFGNKKILFESIARDQRGLSVEHQHEAVRFLSLTGNLRF